MAANLDSSQREAVCCGTGPCEIIAGPGSGKTLVLTERIRYLIEHCNINPSEILVLTFSRAAALEMKERFIRGSDKPYQDVRFGTFHSVFFHILKESSGKNYTILGSSTRDRILNQLLRNYYPDERQRPLVEELDKALHSLTGSEKGIVFLRDIRRDYFSFLRENAYMDFDGMIRECRRLLIENEEVRRYWQEQFRAILVDEFQDINIEQYEVLKLLTSGRGLFVVGDDDQSIYGFRGSSPAVMQKFMDDFRSAQRIRLKYNYRCSGRICRASSLMIRENRMRIAKKSEAAGKTGEKVILRGFREEKEELLYLLNAIKKLSLSEQCRAAVIVRTNLHAAKIQKYLSAGGVQCAGNASPSSDIMDTVLRDLEQYQLLSVQIRGGLLSRESLYRVMNRPERYILRSAAGKEKVTPESLLDYAVRHKGPAGEIREFLHDLSVLSGLEPEGFVRYLFSAVGYADWARQHLGAGEAVGIVLDRILDKSRGAKDLDHLIRSLRGQDFGTGVKKESGVRIITMHVCKGLEFDHVYLPALNEGIIPGRRCRTEEDIEEERRLLYVAMTRAKDHLEMLYVTGTKENPRPPSRFLSVYGIRSFVYSS